MTIRERFNSIKTAGRSQRAQIREQAKQVTDESKSRVELEAGYDRIDKWERDARDELEDSKLFKDYANEKLRGFTRTQLIICLIDVMRDFTHEATGGSDDGDEMIDRILYRLKWIDDETRRRKARAKARRVRA